MTTLRFDHFISYADTPDIQLHLERYRQAGFRVDATTVRHDPGLQNAFLRLGPEYLEFAWVEDEARFAADAGPLRAARDAHRPYALLLHTADPQALHDDRQRRGYALPDVVQRARVDDPDGGPVWSFQPIDGLLPGVASSIITYHRTSAARTQVVVHPNTLYAVQGAVFVADLPEERARQWRDFVAPDAPLDRQPDRCGFSFGPHQALWLTPDAARTLLGGAWAPSAVSELAALWVLATDLGRVREAFEAAGRAVQETADPSGTGTALLVSPDHHDGFIFLVSERPLDQWLEERRQATGEALTAQLPAGQVQAP